MQSSFTGISNCSHQLKPFALSAGWLSQSLIRIGIKIFVFFFKEPFAVLHFNATNTLICWKLDSTVRWHLPPSSPEAMFLISAPVCSLFRVTLHHWSSWLKRKVSSCSWLWRKTSKCRSIHTGPYPLPGGGGGGFATGALWPSCVEHVTGESGSGSLSTAAARVWQCSVCFGLSLCRNKRLERQKFLNTSARHWWKVTSSSFSSLESFSFDLSA